MFIDNLLNTTDFSTITGIDCNEVDTGYVHSLIASTNKVVYEKLGHLFSFTNTTSDDSYRGDYAQSVIYVGAWQPPGVVVSATVTNAGSGYTKTPTVTVTGGGGSGAEAVAFLNGAGEVSSVRIIRQGRNYTTIPTIVFSDEDGANAAATIDSISSLVINKKSNSDDTVLLLEQGTDYKFEHYASFNPRITYPVIGINLYCGRFSSDQYIELTGTYGFSPSVPDELGDLSVALYDIIGKAVYFAENESQSGGSGGVAEAKIGDIAAKYGQQDSGGQQMIERMTQQMAMALVRNIADTIASKYDYTGSLPVILG